MSPRLPDGEAAPADGSLPAGPLAELGARGFGVYVHVPFCASRCGYCDFNTYTWRAPFARPALAELRLAQRVLGGLPAADTVFFGGGTPSLLTAAELAEVLAGIPLAPDAEVTLEANPESVDARFFAELRAAGFNRVSFGVQSAVRRVLATLDRAHSPGRAADAVAEARAAGFDRISVDLIYGTPGETDSDWRTSLEAAIAMRPDSVSAYPLVVEAGTRLAARVRRGELPEPDPGTQERRYAMADERLTAAGLPWYELCNWGAPCRHNLGYWRGADWWGVGPGAHSHVGGVRWWNRLHPTAWAAELAAGASPAAGRERLDAAARRLERAILGLRLREGLSGDEAQRERARRLHGLVEDRDGRLTLTAEGRRQAEHVLRELAAA